MKAVLQRQSNQYRNNKTKRKTDQSHKCIVLQPQPTVKLNQKGRFKLKLVFCHI